MFAIWLGDPSGGHLGASEAPGGVLGAPWGVLGAFWLRFGSVLGCILARGRPGAVPRSVSGIVISNNI